MISQLLFFIVLVVGFGFFSFNISKIRKNISLGKPLDRSDKKAERIKTTLLVALGQKKCFSELFQLYYIFLFT